MNEIGWYLVFLPALIGNTKWEIEKIDVPPDASEKEAKNAAYGRLLAMQKEVPAAQSRLFQVKESISL